MKTISILSLWLSKIAIFFAILIIIVALTPEYIINYAINMGIPRLIFGIPTEVIFGILTVFMGGLGFILGIIGNFKKHKYQKIAQKGFKYGIYSLLILIAFFVQMFIFYISAGGGPK